MSVPFSPTASAILAKLDADLPASYTVHDAQGPTTPTDDVPYVVAYFDAGMDDGAPMQPHRELVSTFAVRIVGEDARQSRAGGDRVRSSLDGTVLTVGGRQVAIWQDQSREVQRDDALSPSALFEQLLIFGLRSTL